MRLALFLVLLTTCSTAPKPCSAANCSGCCDEEGRCTPHPNDMRCGSHGDSCVPCAATHVCIDGLCEMKCTFASCQGCCDLEGECQGGADDVACGSNGAACVDCYVVRAQCVDGVCEGQGAGGGAAGGGTAGGTGGGSGGGTGGGAALALTVFTTSSQVSGTFGGPTQGDALCMRHAADAGLQGTFIAWLSYGSVGALSRFPGGLDGTWTVPGATGLNAVAFANAAQLRATPRRALDRDERGVALAGSAWTGTGDAGTSTGQTCMSWTDGLAGGTWGSVINPAAWSVGGLPGLCSTQRHLYCFEVR